jgi:arginine decarboxylase
MPDPLLSSTFLPKKFFVTGGKAKSTISELNAFDEALMKAGIDQCNLVNVSSIIPKKAKEVRYREIEPGTITHGVYAKMDGLAGERIGAGIGWGRGQDYGVVAEAHGYKDERALKNELRQKLTQMAKARRFDSFKYKSVIETMRVPKRGYGCVIVVLVYLME